MTTMESCVGLFSTVVSGDELSAMPCVDSYYTAPRAWLKTYRNFDDVGSGMKSLFMILTFNDWSVVMYGAMDSSPTATDITQPILDQRWYVCSYFIVYVIISSLFVLQLVVSVIIESFSKVSLNTDLALKRDS